MIGKAKSVSHGINLLSYVTGESVNKKHPELIYHIKDNLLPSGLDSFGIWEQFKWRTMPFRRVTKPTIRFELSPSPEYVQDFTKEDWARLWDDFIREFDNIEMKETKKNGSTVMHKTNIAGSMFTVWLHKESKSGIPHLHCAACRVDENGQTNYDGNFHLRAQWAAERVALMRGWRTAKDKRADHIDKAADACMKVLKSMRQWDWNQYVAGLQAKGYQVVTRPDKNGKIHGYALVKGNASYKASDLGTGRKLTVANLEKTWKRLHPQESIRTTAKTNGTSITQPTKPVRPMPSVPMNDYRHYQSGSVRYTINLDGKEYDRYIPEVVRDALDNEFDYRQVANSNELSNMAMAIFVGLLEAQQAPTSGGGGGSQSDLPWRDKDEDDLKWLKRCMNAAVRHLGKKPKTGMKR